MYKWLIIGLVLVMGEVTASARPLTDSAAVSSDTTGPLVYVFKIMKPIGPPTWRITQKSFGEAVEMGADYILIHMNTYGGTVDAADSIRTKILNSPVPVMVFIDNQAASAGALIAIACDSIYMRKGASIGAATVVDQTGAPAPDKFQSFMRSMMRATAEAHGKDTLVRDNDTLLVWHRDPHIAEAMVDPLIAIEGLVDTGQVLTFTTNEALANGFCEGIAENIPGVLKMAGIKDYELREYKITPMESIIGFLINPVVSGLLIMIIIGGIYFELQSPGVGFPLAAAVTAAVLYFAPLYLEGIAQHWEIILFFIGLVLIAVEIFAIPGFGVAGISGIALIIAGLTLSMVDNIVFEFNFLAAFQAMMKSLFVVLTSMLIAFFLSLFISRKVFTSQKTFAHWALDSVQEKGQGFIGVDKTHLSITVGKTGLATTLLRPSGKVIIDDEVYDAKSEYGFIDKGSQVKVIREEAGQLYVVKIKTDETS